MSRSIPVVVLAGYLGAGKTTLLNHLLRQPDSRLGVVINDFGDINLDAGLVSGQIDEPASIAGGCLCCLPDAGGLSDALARLARPRLRLDAIIVEASGIADPIAVARLIRADATPGIRAGGIVDVVDVTEYFGTVDHGGEPPARFAAASLVVLNKIDLLADTEREAMISRISVRITERNADVYLVPATGARIDPTLLLDPTAADDHRPERIAQPELPWRHRATSADDHAGHRPGDHDFGDHDHARAVTVRTDGPADPDRVADLLDDPPPGAFRWKGELVVRNDRTVRRYRLNIVGRQVHLEPTSGGRGSPSLSKGVSRAPVGCTVVAIGVGLDASAVRQRLDEALAPATTRRSSGSGMDRLDRYVRLSR